MFAQGGRALGIAFQAVWTKIQLTLRWLPVWARLAEGRPVWAQSEGQSMPKPSSDRGRARGSKSRFRQVWRPHPAWNLGAFRAVKWGLRRAPPGGLDTLTLGPGRTRAGHSVQWATRKCEVVLVARLIRGKREVACSQGVSKRAKVWATERFWLILGVGASSGLLWGGWVGHKMCVAPRTRGPKLAKHRVRTSSPNTRPYNPKGR